MKDLYSHVHVCPYASVPFTDNIFCDVELEDVQVTMANSRNSVELLHIWKEWHDKTGPVLKNRFMRYVGLANEAARINGKICMSSKFNENKIILRVNSETNLDLPRYERERGKFYYEKR